MNKGKRILKFKNEIYDFENLIMYFCDDVYQEKFSNGDVENIENGEVFDIKYIIDNYIELNRGVLGDLSHLTYSQKSRFKLMIENSIKKFRVLHLNKKLENDEITKEELEELFKMEDNRNIKEEFENREGIVANIINKFVKINLDNPLPKELSITDVGRFHRLVELVVSENKIFKKPHGNSKEITKKELIDYLQCSETTYKNFLNTMNKFSLVRKYSPIYGKSILFINPIYAHKDLVISKELYNIFKDVITEKLDKKVSKYLEFLYSNSNISGSISYLEN